MERSNIFSIKRFGQVLMKEIKENGRSRMISQLAIMGVFIGIFLWQGIQTYDDNALPSSHDLMWENIQYYYCFGVLIFGCAAASMFMSNMSTKGKRTQVLTTPASDLEKFMSRWLIYMLFYPFMFLVTLCVADIIRVLTLSPFFGNDHLVALFPLDMLWGSQYDGITMVEGPKEFFLLFGFYCIMTSIFALGSSIWHKNAAAKTLLTFIAILLIFLFLGYLLVEGIFTYKKDFGVGIYFRINEGIGFYVSLIIEILLALGINVLAYFRFKESEIIERW